MKLRYTFRHSLILMIFSATSKGNRRKARRGSKAAFRRWSLFFCSIRLLGTRTDDPEIRRMIVLPYPYAVLYEATDDELIIHAVRHTSRKPI